MRIWKSPCTLQALIVAAILILPREGLGQMGASTPDTLPVDLLPGLGNWHHPVSTDNPLAQQFFDQGLALVYAFNHDDAIRHFKKAAALDSNLAMAYWGIALALGPNYNFDVDSAREQDAYMYVQKALRLASHARDDERAYISALAKRYSIDPKADWKQQNVDYKNAMAQVYKQFPDDPDAAVLYAESLMDLHPWKLWDNQGHPTEGTEEIISVLEGVLSQHPDHPGANHYYIHSVEPSPHPERGLASAERLNTLVPAAGHLVHMPAHIYIRTGDYNAAARCNALGMAADSFYLRNGTEGMYPLMYYHHNVHFLSVAYSMEGRSADAIAQANDLAARVTPYAKEIPMIEGFVPTPLLMMVRFRRWDDILKYPAPDSGLFIVSALRHFARGMAYAGTEKVAEAQNERAAFAADVGRFAPDAIISLNSAKAVSRIAEHLLDGKIAVAQHDLKAAVVSLRHGVEAQDTASYDEPESFYIPVRESLGGALLLNGDAAGAEVVFRDELEKHPRSGRALFGLWEALKRQKKTTAAQFVQSEFEAAWKNADVALRVEDL